MKKPIKDLQNEFHTKNLFVASFLLASGKVNFLGLKTLDYKTKLFRFVPKKKAEKLEVAYFSGEVLPVKTVFSEYNSLKDLLFSRESNGDNYAKQAL